MTHERRKQLFERLSRDSDFVEWLRLQEEAGVTALIEQLDPAQIHRTQGKLGVLRTLQRDMEAVRVVR